MAPLVRPPRPLATAGFSEDAVLFPPPFCCSLVAVATPLQTVSCSLRAALTALQFVVCSLHIATTPSPVTNPLDYWGFAAKGQAYLWPHCACYNWCCTHCNGTLVLFRIKELLGLYTPNEAAFWLRYSCRRWCRGHHNCAQSRYQSGDYWGSAANLLVAALFMMQSVLQSLQLRTGPCAPDLLPIQQLFGRCSQSVAALWLHFSCCRALLMAFDQRTMLGSSVAHLARCSCRAYLARFLCCAACGCTLHRLKGCPSAQ